MKDKVQKIREKVEKLKSQLLRGACSSQIAMETRCKDEAYDEVLAILDTMQEEPVSNITDIKSKKAEGKLKECIDSITEESLTKARKQLEEESVSGELDDVASNYVLNIRKGYPRVMDKTDRYICNAFKAGAEWQKEQFEKERLKHCDALTEEQAQIESDFVAKHLKENNRTPTFIDAIEYGMQLMHEKIMKGGVEGTVKFVNTGGDDPFVKFICPDLHSSKFRLNQRVKIIILKKEKL